jgi:hypothetical protein
LAQQDGLDTTVKPVKLPIEDTVKQLGYKPGFSLMSLLEELAKFGIEGPL